MRLRLVLCLAALVALAGCVWGPRQRHYRSNLVDYLYPNGRHDKTRPSRLQLPLKIGLAFVPAAPAPVDPNAEERLLAIVRKAFTGRPWVGEIHTIPSSYLELHGGFDNLEQVAGLMDLDVIALVSVDQIQYNDPTALSLLYVTIVGEYVLPGDRNDTRTMIDVAVVDVRSHSFLLRAPGTSHISGVSTPVAAERRLRGKSDVGLQRAMVDLTGNLDREVGTFKASVAEGQRADVDIVTKEGKSLRGGGAMDGPATVMVLIILAAVFLGRRKTA
jgi:rhombotail lipoprotein